MSVDQDIKLIALMVMFVHIDVIVAIDKLVYCSTLFIACCSVFITEIYFLWNLLEFKDVLGRTDAINNICAIYYLKIL